MPDPVKEKAEYQKATGHNTPMLMQYWKLKAQHFDKARDFLFVCLFVCLFVLFWRLQDDLFLVGVEEKSGASKLNLSQATVTARIEQICIFFSMYVCL